MPEPESQLIRARQDSLARFRARGVDPYPHRVERTHTTAEAVARLESLEREGADAESGECVSVAGRIMQVRGMGKATFLDIQDGHGRIQALLRRNVLQESYEGIRDLDIGDWLGVTGPLMRTRTGEPTVEVRQWKLLSKSLRPLPEKWHGLVDVEARYRRRYLDLISNEEARRIGYATQPRRIGPQPDDGRQRGSWRSRRLCWSPCRRAGLQHRSPRTTGR